MLTALSLLLPIAVFAQSHFTNHKRSGGKSQSKPKWTLQPLRWVIVWILMTAVSAVSVVISEGRDHNKAQESSVKERENKRA